MKLSPSALKKWMACPLQVKLAEEHQGKFLLSANMAYGTAVHAALEVYNMGADVDDAVEFFLDIWDHPEKLNIVPDFYYPRTSFGGFREKGPEAIIEYDVIHRLSSREIVASEFKFCVPFGKHYLSGIVDYLEYEKGTDTLYICDLKSGQRPNADQLHMDVQFTTYMYAVTQKEFWVGNPEQGARYKGFENGAELFRQFCDSNHVGLWYDLRNNKEYDVGKRDDQDFLRLYRCLDEIDRAIEHSVYVPDISGNTCKWCDFKSVCPAYVMPENQVEII